MAKRPGEAEPPEQDDTHDADFQFVLRELLGAYEPILEEDLKRAKSPEELKKEAEARPPNCDDEIALANRLFERFFTEQVAVRLLPGQARELLGPIDRWRWCLLHIRCCMIFGWLICRGPRTFRAFIYYLYRYWICVRQALGTPVGSPLTPDQRQDFESLVKALAGAYKPYLTDQLATVEFPAGLSDEVLAGKIDCFEGDEAAAAIFERLLTVETAQALLGKEAFARHSQEAWFWFCRCWCLCAIRFGCCLARARTLLDVFHCLRFYRRCLRECFRPLTCKIIHPNMGQCVEEQYFPGPNVLGVEIVGTATGAFCDHYTLEWKPAGWPDSAYSSTAIVYAPPAGPAGPGACGMVNSTLGYLSTATAAIPDSVTVRLCVFGTPSAGAPVCCLVDFQIFRQRVWITAVEGVLPETPPGLLDPTAQLKTGGVLRAFGTRLQISGRAWVGKCPGREIKRYTLSYQPGFVTDPTLGAWTQFWQVDYLTALQQKEIPTGEFALTSSWRYQPICLPSPPFPPGTCFPKDWLDPARWTSGGLGPGTTQSFPVDPQVPAVVWSEVQLPALNCQSGKYTLRVDVEDTLTNHYYDLQQVWFDNKEIYGKITQVAGVDPCATINLSQFAAPGADCTVPWLADILGIAYDEYIEEGNTAIPSDNYSMVGGVVQGGYLLWIKKDGAPDPGVPLHIPGPGAPPWIAPFGQGTTRIGDPAVRCATAVPPPGPIPAAELPATLATLDFRRLDAVCNLGEPALTLNRGECCGYIIRLAVFDNSVCPSLSGGRHQIGHHFPVCICNDLPPVR